MPNPSLITEELLDALAQVESSGNPNAIGDRNMRNRAIGAYQMRQPAYLDVVQANPAMQGRSLESLLGDMATQREYARAYLQLLEGRYGLDTLEEILSGYNAGPTAARRGVKVPAYINKVQRAMRSR